MEINRKKLKQQNKRKIISKVFVEKTEKKIKLFQGRP